MSAKIRSFLIQNAVVILFVVLIAFAVPVSGLPSSFLLQEILTRLGRNTFLVVALLLPIMAGMGLNFGMVLGAMAGQLGLIFITDWGVIGIPGLLLAMIISLPISVLLGWLCGSIMNLAKGREMVTGFILAFFMNGLYMMVVLYAMGVERWREGLSGAIGAIGASIEASAGDETGLTLLVAAPGDVSRDALLGAMAGLGVGRFDLREIGSHAARFRPVSS